MPGGPRVSQYAAADPVQLVAGAIGRKPSVVAQLLKISDPRSPFIQVAEIAAALLAGGRGDVLDRLCLPLELARLHVRPKLTPDLIANAQSADLAEDVTENEVRAFPSLEGKRRWLKTVDAEIIALTELAAALRQECGL